MRKESLRTLLAIAAIKGFETKFIDVETAYLNGRLKRKVYMKTPRGVNIEGGKILLIEKSLYGLPEAGRC